MKALLEFFLGKKKHWWNCQRHGGQAWEKLKKINKMGKKWKVKYD